MEQDRFDALAISLADEGTSRRSVLGRIAASGVAAALGITAFTAFEDDAEAKKCKKKCNKKEGNAKKRCKRKCNKKKNPPVNPSSCSSNTNCAGGQICINARCTSTCTGNGQCAAGQVCLNGACTTACTSNANCAGGQVCVNGGCTNACLDSGDCTGGQICIEGVCGTPNDPPDDPAVDLCDATTPCPSGLLCVAGVCVLGCENDADCADGLICGNLLGGSLGSLVCIQPDAQCGPGNPCPGALVSLCVLGICVEIGGLL